MGFQSVPALTSSNLAPLVLIIAVQQRASGAIEWLQRSQASLRRGFFLGLASECYKVATDDVPYIC